LLAHAETLARLPQFDAADRAEVLYRQGCVSLKQNRIADASALSHGRSSRTAALPSRVRD